MHAHAFTHTRTHTHTPCIACLNRETCPQANAPSQRECKQKSAANAKRVLANISLLWNILPSTFLTQSLFPLQWLPAGKRPDIIQRNQSLSLTFKTGSDGLRSLYLIYLFFFSCCHQKNKKTPDFPLKKQLPRVMRDTFKLKEKQKLLTWENKALRLLFPLKYIHDLCSATINRTFGREWSRDSNVTVNQSCRAVCVSSFRTV